MTAPSSSTHDPATSRPWLWRVAIGWFSIACLGTALVGSARWHWSGELAVSFSWHLGWASFAVAALFAFLRQRRLALVAAGLWVLHSGPELLLWVPTGAPEAGDGRDVLEVASCNLLYDNGDHRSFLDWVEEHDPDVLVCAEVSVAWRGVLAGLADRYPHQLVSPVDEAWWAGTWGTAILSRVPFEATRLYPFEKREQRPLMEAVISLDGRPLTLRGAHPMRPGSAWRQTLRDEVLEELGSLEWSAASLLVGDLNAASTSPAFSRLLARTGLADSRRGFGRQPTWRTPMFLPALVAIDHALVGSDVRVLSRQTSELPGSDHLAVVVRVAVSASTTAD